MRWASICTQKDHTDEQDWVKDWVSYCCTNYVQQYEIYIHITDCMYINSIMYVLKVSQVVSQVLCNHVALC